MENNKIKTWDVWQYGEWVEYTLEELNQYFHFVNKPNWNNVREIFFFEGGNKWIRLVYNNCIKEYNNVFGTYVRI